MIVNKYWIAVVAGITLLACDDDQPKHDTRNGTILYKVSDRGVDPENTYRIKYNSEGFISEKETYYKDEKKLLSSMVYEYTDGKLANVSVYRLDENKDLQLAARSLYIYDDNGMLERITSETGGHVWNIRTVTWSNNRIVKISSPYRYDTLEYDDRGNILEERSYSIRDDEQHVLTHRREYEFDDKPNPVNVESNGYPFTWPHGNNNNIIRMHSWNVTDGVESTSSLYTYEYQYNEYGLPVICTNKTVDGNAPFVERHFYYK